MMCKGPTLRDLSSLIAFRVASSELAPALFPRLRFFSTSIFASVSRQSLHRGQGRRGQGQGIERGVREGGGRGGEEEAGKEATGVGQGRKGPLSVLLGSFKAGL